jgi:predicted N-acyltransferase
MRPQGETANFTIHVARSLSEVDRDAWDVIANPPGPYDPFIAWDFLEALEATGCVGGQSGWQPVHLLARDSRGGLIGAAPLYLKSHSYGEYVFDHSWADALRRAGGRYYPKLQCAAPFTPVTGRRLLAEDPHVRQALARRAMDLAEEYGASSVHLTFLTKPEQDEIAGLGFLKRYGVQFHWEDASYGSFDGFLAALSANKRKNIRKERARACEDLDVAALRGDAITPAIWDFFFRCYMDTGARKWGSPYLNRAFFRLLGERMGERCVLFVAKQEGRPIAAALNLLGSDTIYGRYWGRLEDAPFLHFELCYYRAIDYALEHGLTRVEAGAQGEHKLLRGYAPVATCSSHWIAHPGLHEAVRRFLDAETPAVVDEIEQLAEHTPFKKDC